MIAGPVDRHVGNRVREARRAKDMAQPALAQALGVVPQQLSKLERGVNAMHASHIYNAALALGVPPGWFFEGLPGVRSGR